MICVEHEVEQRTDEWHMLRLGRLTGSRAKDAVAVGRGGEAYTKRDYRLELCCERLTGIPAQQIRATMEMIRGVEMEASAVEAFQIRSGLFVGTSGFLSSPDHMIGCSLDGYIGESAANADLIVEVKCPKSTTHLKWLKSGRVPAEHLAQLRHNLWCSHADAAWFVSYDDRLPYDLSLFAAQITKQQADLNQYEDQAMAFLASVDDLMLELKTLTTRSAA
jgi:putative phage-type endonuclease